MKKRLLTGLGALLLVAPGAMSGPNTGVLVLALEDTVVYTTDIEDYCQLGGTPRCEEAISSYGDTDTVILNALAYFAGSPRLAGVTFGIGYPESEFTIVGYGHCGDFELATGGWPGSGEGTAVTWSTTQTTDVTEVYWIAGYNYYGSAIDVDVIPHPSQGAFFADDDVPSTLDPIQALGSFGFGGNPGFLPCIVVEPGACCLECGECFVVMVEECDALGGDYQGDLTFCDPNPCPQPPPGACCFEDESCEILDWCMCEDRGGDFLGEDVPCDPNPCGIVPTVESSWGSIKREYR